MKRLLLVTALAVAASIAAAGQARATDYKVFLGEQVPCGFAKIPGCPAGIPSQTTLDPFFPGQGDDRRRRHDHVLERDASIPPRTVLKPPAFFLPDPAKGKYARAERRGGQPVLLRRAARSSIYNGAGVRPVRPEDDPGRDADLERRALVAGTARRRSRRRSPTRSRRRARYKLFCTIHPGMKATVTVKPAGTRCR